MEALVFQSDFGLSDGAVCAMYGVAQGVEPKLRLYDLTHDIAPYNIWEASYRLIQTITYWPEDTVFVSVVDPGVGSNRRSIAALTNTNHVIITPDNGTLTHIQRLIGIKELREIDETVNRLPNSKDIYTFHGRDVYAFTGARLASGKISFREIGPKLELDDLVCLPIVEPTLSDGSVEGTIDVLDVRFGSIWTNISQQMLVDMGIRYGDRVQVEIYNDTRALYRNIMVFGHSFADVYVGEPLMYINSLEYAAIAINQGSFARAYNIGTGNNWHIRISPFQY